MLEATTLALVQFSCCLSMIGALLVGFTWWYPEGNRLKPGRILLLWLSVADFMASLTYFLGTFKDLGDIFCTIGALAGIFFPVASFLWTDCIAYFLYIVIKNRCNQHAYTWKTLLRRFHIICWGLSLVVVIFVLAFNHAGEDTVSDDDEDGDSKESSSTGGWCWIKANNRSERFVWELIGGKLIEWLSCLVILPYLYTSVALQLRKVDIGADGTAGLNCSGAGEGDGVGDGYAVTRTPFPSRASAEPRRGLTEEALKHPAHATAANSGVGSYAQMDYQQQYQAVPWGAQQSPHAQTQAPITARKGTDEFEHKARVSDMERNNRTDESRAEPISSSNPSAGGGEGAGGGGGDRARGLSAHSDGGTAPGPRDSTSGSSAIRDHSIEPAESGGVIILNEQALSALPRGRSLAAGSTTAVVAGAGGGQGVGAIDFHDGPFFGGPAGPGTHGGVDSSVQSSAFLGTYYADSVVDGEVDMGTAHADGPPSNATSYTQHQHDKQQHDHQQNLQNKQRNQHQQQQVWLQDEERTKSQTSGSSGRRYMGGMFTKFYLKLAAVPVVFFMLRFWGSLRVLLQYAHPASLNNSSSLDSFLLVMQACFDPSQGFFNALLFVFASTEDRQNLLLVISRALRLCTPVLPCCMAIADSVEPRLQQPASGTERAIVEAEDGRAGRAERSSTNKKGNWDRNNVRRIEAAGGYEEGEEDDEEEDGCRSKHSVLSFRSGAEQAALRQPLLQQDAVGGSVDGGRVGWGGGRGGGVGLSVASRAESGRSDSSDNLHLLADVEDFECASNGRLSDFSFDLNDEGLSFAH